MELFSSENKNVLIHSLQRLTETNAAIYFLLVQFKGKIYFASYPEEKEDIWSLDIGELVYLFQMHCGVL